jgi:hypothetical protein
MRIFLRTLACIVIHLIAFSFLSAQPESWFVTQIALHLNGHTEVGVENGRIDVVTVTHAIEVERAANWKHAIGQSLWYAMQKNLSPGIVLIVLDGDDWKMGIRLNSTLEYAGLADKVKVWYYPQDFSTTAAQSMQLFESERITDPSATGFWLTTNSGVRHNKTCQWYTQSKGRYCIASEGRPCGKCGG